MDTSMVIRNVESTPPTASAISVITLGELRAGVRFGGDPSVRAQRQARLVAIRDAFLPLPVDEAVADHYGDVLAAAAGSSGRTTKATDLLIIATAAATGRVLWTLDRRQAKLAEAVGVAVAVPGD
jgi:predicted nucleic acid-binding protein